MEVKMKRKPLKFVITLPFRRGDRVQINSHPFHRGTIAGIEAHMNFSDEPHISYRVQTETTSRVSRYVGTEDLTLLKERTEAQP
jgi:hypothetical protein